MSKPRYYNPKGVFFHAYLLAIAALIAATLGLQWAFIPVLLGLVAVIVL